VVTVDVTTEDIASLGMCVVRAIVPGYHPHLPGFLTRPLGGNRLLKMPQQLGYTGIAQQDDANPFPHPFA
jgi:ribosomal protein S12 methylthiotransferase accessory factor